jgi:hypothetical protein
MQFKKIKLNKNFQPIACDLGDELYPNGIFEFNITKLIDFINKNKNEFLLEEIEVKTIRYSSTNPYLNKAAIKSANLSSPIILAEISPGMFNVIDGHHRLEKSYLHGMNKILAYKVLALQHIMFLTSTVAYEAYVEYWNEKVKIRKKCVELQESWEDFRGAVRRL